MKHQPQRMNLSPKQATALRRIAKRPIPIADAQGIVQTTWGALWRREFIMLRGGGFHITDAGLQALDAQIHSTIERAHYAPFAGVIRELANYRRPDEKADSTVREMRRTA